MSATNLSSLARTHGPTFPVLIGLSVAHCLNDLVQSLLPAIYPLLKTTLHLDYGQIGLITLSFQLTASLLQPIIGIYTDKHPKPYSLAAAMLVSMTGLVLLSQAHSFLLVLIAAAIVGAGSSIFHPESSRVARMASGGRFGLAQSLFQVGGNAGSAIGPLLAAFIVLPNGQSSIAWFAAISLLGFALLFRVSGWYADRLKERAAAKPRGWTEPAPPPITRQAAIGVVLLLLLTFSKNFYFAGITSFYTFYLMQKFALPVQQAQILLFVFLAAFAAGTFLGGPIGDRYGRRIVVWGSILGVLPFTLALPYANLPGTIILSILIGLIMASAFSAIVVYAQELTPGRVGAVAGLFFGAAFGLGGIGAAVLGALADATSLDFVYKICSFLPAIGVVTLFIPKTPKTDHSPR